MKTLLSFGHGYSARALAPLLLDRGWRVVGTSRDPGKRAQPGVEMCRFPGDDIADDLQAATHILVSAGPDADGDPVLRELGQEIARHRYDCLKSHAKPPSATAFGRRRPFRARANQTLRVPRLLISRPPYQERTEIARWLIDNQCLPTARAGA